MWICPVCHREFKTKNQWHSCVVVKVDELLDCKPAYVKYLYNILWRYCQNLGPIKTDTTKSCIYFVGQHRFIAIKPQSNGLILEFVLNKEYDIFPVIKTFKMSKGQFVHRIKIDAQEEINQQLLCWIKEAFLLQESKNSK